MPGSGLCLAGDYNVWLVKYRSQDGQIKVTFVHLENRQPKTNEVFWGMVQKKGAERMSISSKPEAVIEEMLEDEVVYWLERCRWVHRFMKEILQTYEDEDVIVCAELARGNALHIGRACAERLKTLNPNNPAITEPLIDRQLPHFKAWDALEELRANIKNPEKVLRQLSFIDNIQT